jgi:hypothetical protein
VTRLRGLRCLTRPTSPTRRRVRTGNKEALATSRASRQQGTRPAILCRELRIRPSAVALSPSPVVKWGGEHGGHVDRAESTF